MSSEQSSQTSPSGTPAVTCKNLFGVTQHIAVTKKLAETEKTILVVFRFRFEPVAQAFKLQRPYVVTSRSISLVANKPAKIC